jgi:hypothetical protein
MLTKWRGKGGGGRGSISKRCDIAREVGLCGR